MRFPEKKDFEISFNKLKNPGWGITGNNKIAAYPISFFCKIQGIFASVSSTGRVEVIVCKVENVFDVGAFQMVCYCFREQVKIRKALLIQRIKRALYPERESNPHGRNGHRILSPACLPIPPPGHVGVNLKKNGCICDMSSFTLTLTHPPTLNFERKTGFEPATPTLARSCSTS